MSRGSYNPPNQPDTSLPHPGKPAALAALREIPQWGLWRWESVDGAKPTKIPYYPLLPYGRRARANEPEHWHTFQQAEQSLPKAMARNADFRGLAFCTAGQNEYIFLDLDDCIADGQLLPWAQELVRRCASYTEITPSGSGLRIIGRAGGAVGLDPGHKREIMVDGQKIEVFHGGANYLTVSGSRLPDTRDVLAPIGVITAELLQRSGGAKPRLQVVGGTEADRQPLDQRGRRYHRVEVERLAQGMPNDEKDNDHWRKVIGAFCNVSGGEDWGRDLAFAWSAKSPHHDEDETRAVWDRARSGGGHAFVGVDTLLEQRRKVEPDYRLAPDVETEMDDVPGDMGKKPKPAAATKPPKPAPPQQASFARMVAARLCDRLRYIPVRDSWALFEEGRWHLLEGAGAFELVRREVEREAAPMPQGVRRAMLSHAWIRAIATLVQNDPKIEAVRALWDQDPYLLMTRGGVVDLHDGTVRPADGTDLMLRCTACAPAEPGVAMPVFDGFLADAFAGDREMLGFVQKAFGMALFGHTQRLKSQVMLILHGVSNTGKTTLLTTLVEAVGDYGMPIAPEVLLASDGNRHKTEIATLDGVRIAVMSEVTQGRSFSTNKLKSLTGGDIQNARFLFQDEFKFAPSHTFFLAVNNLPRVMGDDAIRRRLRVVRMNHKPAALDDRLPQLLEAERPQILRWMIEGAVSFHQLRAAGQEPLAEPASVKLETDAYVGSSDPVGTWFETMIEVTRNSEDWIAGRDVQEALELWVSENGSDLGGLSRRDCEQRLALLVDAAGCGEKRKRVGKEQLRGFYGIRIRPDPLA